MAEEEKGGDGVYTMIAADDGSLPVKTDEAKQAMLKQRKMFEMDSYYKYIENHTYRTEFVSITFDQANALKLYLRGIDLTEEKYSNQQKEFENLEQNIKNAINKLKNDINDEKEGTKFFVRMSTRSPKDACDKPLFRDKLMNLMKERFINIDNDNNMNKLNDEYMDLNQRLIGLRECFSKVLCVETCQEMLQLLSFSERCVSDLKRLIDHKHLLEKWDLYLVIRQFKFIPICNEFRCFVNNSKLTAITQYFPHCYFPKLIHENKDKIRNMINDYYNNVFLKECNDLNTELNNAYILDLNVDVINDKILIIELNPFAQTTGPGFFDWIKDKDLLYGDLSDDDNKIYPEIRIRTETEKHLNAVLSQWEPVFTQFEKEINGNDEEDDTCDCRLM